MAKNDGRVLLGPTLPGGIAVMTVNAQRSVLMNDGAFLACDEGVKVRNVTQSLGRALFGGSGGFFVMEASGSGHLAVSGFGSTIEYDVKPGQDVLVDNYHLLAWESHLQYEVAVNTAKKGRLSSLVNGVTSGEGAVNRVHPRQAGKLWIAPRNRRNFASWISAQARPSR
jgi:uncharacterized protein (AIM24 family)